MSYLSGAMVAFPFWLFDSLCGLLLVATLAAVSFGRRLQAVFHPVTFIAGVAMVAIAVSGWLSPSSWHVVSPIGFAFFPVQFRIDTTAALLVGLLGVVTAAVSLFQPSYLRHLSDRINLAQYWSCFFVFLLSLALVVLSADAITFVVFWELMSLSSAGLVACEHKQHKVQQATMIYVGATRIATAFLAAGFLWMHAISHSWNFTDWHFSDPVSIWPAWLILVGFAIKAGFWPFHIWLPYAHPVAPAPVSALMSGVMIKVAIYGIIRVLIGGGLNDAPVAYLLLFIGTVSSFWGVLFGLVQADLKKLLAYSSVENIGLIGIALGVSMLAHNHGLEDIAVVAFAAALLHMVNHGIFKSLLFLGAGAADAQAHSRDLNHLGGLGKTMPWTMACFVVGSAAICALPPLNGFASKWLIYQSLFRITWESGSLIERSIAMVAIGVLALVGGLAVACFAKAIGVVFLGRPRTRAADLSHEVGMPGVLAQVLLAGVCVTLGVTAPYAVAQLAPAVGTIYGGVAPLSTVFYMPIGIIAACFFTIVVLLYGLFLQTSKTRKYITWECGFGDLSPRAQVSAQSFSQPIAQIFRPLLRFKLAIKIRGKDRRHFPEYISIEPRMVSLLERGVYAPALALVENSAKTLAKLQAGSIHLYLLYVCITLVVLLFVGTRL